MGLTISSFVLLTVFILSITCSNAFGQKGWNKVPDILNQLNEINTDDVKM